MKRFRMEPRLYRATRENTLLEELSTEVIDGTVEANEDARHKMAFSARLTDTGLLQPHVDYLAPFLKITFDDGTVREDQLGLYIVLPPEEATHGRTHSTEDIDGRSVDWLLDADTFDTGYTVPAGVDYVKAATDIIETTGITRYSIPLSGVTVPAPITWIPGDSKLDMVNYLLNAVGYYTVWPDNTGRPMSFPYLNLDNAQPSRRYVEGDTAEVIGDVRESKQYTSLANVIVVIKEGEGDDTDLVSVRRNDNPASPISTSRLGVTIRRTERANVETQAAADSLADRLLQESMSYYRRMTLRAIPDPGRGLHEVVDVELSRGGNPLIEGRWWARKWVQGLTMERPYIEFDLNRVDRWVTS